MYYPMTIYVQLGSIMFVVSKKKLLFPYGLMLKTDVVAILNVYSHWKLKTSTGSSNEHFYNIIIKSVQWFSETFFRISANKNIHVLAMKTWWSSHDSIMFVVHLMKKHFIHFPICSHFCPVVMAIFEKWLTNKTLQVAKKEHFWKVTVPSHMWFSEMNFERKRNGEDDNPISISVKFGFIWSCDFRQKHWNESFGLCHFQQYFSYILTVFYWWRKPEYLHKTTVQIVCDRRIYNV